MPRTIRRRWDTEHFAATETNNDWNFDHQGPLQNQHIKNSRRFQRCTTRTQCRPIPSKCGFKIIGVQRRCRTRLAGFKSTPKIRRAIKTREWSSEAIGASRVDILKTSSLTASGTKLGAGVVYLGAGSSGQTSVTVEHNFDTTGDYVVFAMVVNAKANNAAGGLRVISDGFGAHIFDKAATAFKVQYGRHSKYSRLGRRRLRPSLAGVQDVVQSFDGSLAPSSRRTSSTSPTPTPIAPAPTTRCV